MNKLYFGDNLDILRQHIATESVDLVYLDPPFNSKRGYNILYKTPKGQESQAQAIAFQDTWSWGEQSEREFEDIKKSSYTSLSQLMVAMRSFMRESDMMTYLVMMARRLMELHRILKPTGSIYLHCDSTANHYLRILLDNIFGSENFRNEIIWKRQSSHNDAINQFAAISDTIFFYVKSPAAKFNVVRRALDPEYVAKFYRHKDVNGRLYQLDNMASPNPRPNMMYDWMGYAYPPKGWRYEKATMQKLHDEGRIYYPSDKKQRPRLKRYLDENQGMAVPNVWDDINSLVAGAKEFLGYPTQKPLPLLERIIQASSKPGDVVLDPFCGCGTAVHAAQKLGRQWIGIDITHMAISLIEKRLRDAFKDIQFETEGVPKDTEGARDLAQRDKYQFQWWACSLVNAQPYQGKKKGADGGIDGLIYFTDVQDGKRVDQKIIVSVKGGDNVGLTMLKDLVTTVEHNKAQIGLFVTLVPPTQPMIAEAAKAGFYHAGNGREYPRIQILTIEDLMTKRKRAEYIDLSLGQETFKQAPTEQTENGQPRLL